MTPGRLLDVPQELGAKVGNENPLISTILRRMPERYRQSYRHEVAAWAICRQPFPPADGPPLPGRKLGLTLFSRPDVAGRWAIQRLLQSVSSSISCTVPGTTGNAAGRNGAEDVPFELPSAYSTLISSFAVRFAQSNSMRDTTRCRVPCPVLAMR